MKLYRGLNIACGLVSFVGAMAVVLPAVLANRSILLPVLLAFLWVVLCAIANRKLVIRRLNKIMALLDDCRIGEYVAEYEKLLPRAKNSDALFVRLNLSAGYIEQGHPRKALDILRDLPDIPAGRRGTSSRLCYENNTAVCHRMLGDLDTAETLMETLRSDLETAPEKTPQLAQIASNYQAQACLLRMARGNFEGSRALFEGQLPAASSERSRVAAHYALAWVSLREGRKDESARHLEYVLAHGGDTWYVGAARERMRQLRIK